MKIYAPVTDVNGIYASVMFTNGVGETDNPALIEWFRSHGYRVELGDITEPIAPIYNAPTWEVGGNESVEDQRIEMAPIAPEKEPEMLEHADQPDFEAMTPLELREWMREHGYGGKIKNTKNKDKLLEILRG